MGKKMFSAEFRVLHGPMNNTEFTAYRAHDSTSMVMIALHNPPIPAIPMALRMVLACKMSRITIMRVRRTLSDSEIEKYGRTAQMLPDSCAFW